MCLQLGVGEEPKRFYSTLPGPLRGRERDATCNGRRKEEGSQGGGGVKHSLYQSPHLLLLQGYNRQVRMKFTSYVTVLENICLSDIYRVCCRTAWCTCSTESNTQSVRRLRQHVQTSAFSLLTSCPSTAACAESLQPVVMPITTTKEKMWGRGSALLLSRCSTPQFW